MPARRRPALPPESLSSLSPCLPPPTSWSPGAGRCLGLQWKLRGCNQHQQARGCCHHSCAAASTRSFPRPGSGQAAPRQRVLSNPCKLGSGNPKSRPIKNPKSRPIQNPNPKSRPSSVRGCSLLSNPYKLPSLEILDGRWWHRARFYYQSPDLTMSRWREKDAAPGTQFV